MYRLTIGRTGHRLTSLPVPAEYREAARKIVNGWNAMRKGDEPTARLLKGKGEQKA